MLVTRFILWDKLLVMTNSMMLCGRIAEAYRQMYNERGVCEMRYEYPELKGKVSDKGPCAVGGI